MQACPVADRYDGLKGWAGVTGMIVKTTNVKKCRRQEGSTLLLVLAMLSVLVLVAAGLAYTSRIEGTASANFAQATQARIAANTGLPYSITLLRMPSAAATSPLEPWAKAPAALSQATHLGSASARSVGKPPMQALYGRALRESGLDKQAAGRVQAAGLPPASVTIKDLSGQININAIRSDKALGRVLQAALSSHGGARGASPDARARALLAVRGSAPNEGGRNSAGESSVPVELLDPRLGPAPAGFHRFESLAELGRQSSRGRAPVFSKNELHTLGSALTTFSQAPEIFHGADGTTIPKVSLSDLTAESALAVLRAAFPQKDDRLLQQFAANLADALDSDFTPTLLANGESSGPADVVLGLERKMPFVTEVYADAKTADEDGDQGQFVEIHNPWPEPLVMLGWRLELGDGSSIQLNSVVPSNGYLILTDNYESPAQNAPPETGSFVSIFGLRGDNGPRKVVENSALVLPNHEGIVRLYDERDRLIDLFAWEGGAASDGTSSYQRNDPRVRVASLSHATPFQHPMMPAGSAPGETNAAISTFAQPVSFAPEALRHADLPRPDDQATSDAWVRSPVDLLQISTAYAAVEPDNGTGREKLTAHSWQRPDWAVAAEETATNLDARLVDLFTTARPVQGAAVTARTGMQPPVLPRTGDTRSAPSRFASPERSGFTGSGSFGARTPGKAAGVIQSADHAVAASRIEAFRQGDMVPTTTLTAAAASRRARSARNGGRSGAGSQADTQSATMTLPLLYTYGRLNLNTASEITLQGLDGEIEGKDHLGAEQLAKLDKHRTERLRDGKTPFGNVSDLLGVLFPGEPGREEMRVFARLVDQVTVDSCAFEVISENRIAGGQDARRRVPRARLKWTVSLDREPFSLLDYTDLR